MFGAAAHHGLADVVREAFEDLDAFGGELVLPPVVELQQADDRPAGPDRNPGDGTVVRAQAQVVRVGAGIGPRLQHRPEIVRPAAAARGKPLAAAVEQVGQRQPADAPQRRAAGRVRQRISVRVQRAQVPAGRHVFGGEALLGDERIVVALAEVDADRVEFRLLPQQGDDLFQQLVEFPRLAEDLDRLRAHREIGLRALGGGDVDVGADQHRRGAVLVVPQAPAPGQDPDPVAIGVAHAEDMFVHARRVPHVVAGFLPDAVAVLGMDQIQPDGFDVALAGGQREVGGVAAQHGEIGVAGPQVAGVGVVFPGARVGRADQRFIACRRFLLVLRQLGQGLVRPLARRDVRAGAPIAPQLAVGVPHRNAAAEKPENLPRLRLHGVDQVADGLALRGERREGGPEPFAADLGMQIVDVLPADQFVGPVAQRRVGQIGQFPVEPIGVDFPAGDAVLPRQQIEAADAFGQGRGADRHLPFQILPAVDDETGQQRAGGRQGEARQQHEPAEIRRMLGEKLRRGRRRHGVGLAEGHHGAGRRPRRRHAVRQSLRRRGQPFRRPVRTQLPQFQRDLPAAFELLARGGFQQLPRIQHRHGEALDGSGRLGPEQRAEDQDLGMRTRGAGQRAAQVGRRDHAVRDRPGHGAADLRQRPEIASRGDAVFRQRHEGFHVVEGIIGVPAGSAGALPVRADFPNLVAAQAVFPGLLFEAVPRRRRHDRHPAPGQHLGFPHQVAGVAAEFLPGHVDAALDEMGDAFDLRVAQIVERAENAPGAVARQRGERLLPVAVFRRMGRPHRRQSQDQAAAGDQRRFQPVPAAFAARRRVVPPAPHLVARRRHGQQQRRRQQRHGGGAHQPPLPLFRRNVDAQHGQQLAIARICQRHAGADPPAPAVLDRSLRDGGNLPVEKPVHHRRGFFVQLARRGIVGRVRSFRIHVEKHHPVGAAHQINPAPVRLDPHRRPQVLLEQPVFRLGFVGGGPGQGLDAFQRQGLGHEPGLLQQVRPHPDVFAPHRPQREQRPGQQDGADDRTQPLSCGDVRQQSGGNLTHALDSDLGKRPSPSGCLIARKALCFQPSVSRPLRCGRVEAAGFLC